VPGHVMVLLFDVTGMLERVMVMRYNYIGTGNSSIIDTVVSPD